jgi:L-lactate dehydrogenase complex protein LldG
LFTWAATSPRRYMLAQHLAGLLGGLGSFLAPSHGAQDRSWLRLPALTGWGYSKDFPRPAARPFRSRFVVGEVSPLSRHASPEDQSDHASQSNPMPGTGDANKAQDIFAAEVSALGATFTRCAENELVENILSLLRERRIDSILSWSEDQLPAGLLAGLRQAGIQIVHPTYETKSADHIPHIGLTGALAGVADSGTLILPGGPGRPLTASLLPEIHIAVIQREKIYHDLPQALNLQEVREASAAVLVSGPSRTADIEMTLTIGVHGPGELHIFCY